MREAPWWVKEHLKKTIYQKSDDCLFYAFDRPAGGFCTYQRSDFTDKTPADPVFDTP